MRNVDESLASRGILLAAAYLDGGKPTCPSQSSGVINSFLGPSFCNPYRQLLMHSFFFFFSNFFPFPLRFFCLGANGHESMTDAKVDIVLFSRGIESIRLLGLVGKHQLMH